MFTESEFVRLGGGLREALEAFVHALESGAWVYDPSAGRVFPKTRKKGKYPNGAYEFGKYQRRKRPS